MLRYLTAIILFSVLIPAYSQDNRILSLDGTWQILFDPENAGRQAGWADPGIFSAQEGIQDIQVPGCWEEIAEDYEGVAFYLKRFHVPSSWKGKTMELCFDAVNYLAEVWVNNVVLGYHEGGFTPFRFRVEHAIKAGEENVVTLRVTGPVLLTDQRIDGTGRMEVPQWRGAITGGIWQPVSLRASGEVLIRDVFAEPDIRNKSALFHLEFDNTLPETCRVSLQLDIFSACNEKIASTHDTLCLLPGSNKTGRMLQLPDPCLWSPENPCLYRVNVRISRENEISDETGFKFGMREFTVAGSSFSLNGSPYYVKGCFFEGLYPVKAAFPDSREMAVREIMLAKEAGFNLIRPWRKPPPPMWLDLCDSLGVLTIGSIAVECMERPIATPQLPRRVENELRESVLRDRNRSCVIMWELFNELHQPVLIQMLHPMSLLSRELDPTRLILDESGGWARGARLYLPYQRTGQRFNDVHDYAGSQITESRFNGYLLLGTTREERMKRGFGETRIPGRNVVPGLLTFISEMGYGSLPDLVENNKQFKEAGNPILPAARYHERLEHELRDALGRTGLDKVYGDFREFCTDQQTIHGLANKRMIEAARCNPGVIGYCVHALTDGDWILGAALIDLWRNPKKDAFEMTRMANQPRIAVVRVLPRNIYAGQGARLEIKGVNDQGPVSGKLTVEIHSAKNEKVFRWEKETSLEHGISEFLNVHLDTEEYLGTYTVSAVFRDGNGVSILSGDGQFDVFPDRLPPAPLAEVSLIDPAGSLIPFLEKSGIGYTLFNKRQELTLPVLVGRIPADTRGYRSEVEEAREFVKRGGFALFLEVPGENLPTSDRVLADVDAASLPFGARLLNTVGLWAGRPHIVKDHPVFEGLPVNGIMHGVYENVHPAVSMIRQEGEYLCGVVSYDHFRNIDKNLRHYNGPGDVWWGADVLLTPSGEGNMLLSTLKILENLGKDPVADRLLFNMIRFAGGK